MVPLPPASDGGGGRLLTYTVGEDEPMTEAVVEAFVAADVDVYDGRPPLQEWINADALDAIEWGSGPEKQFSTHIWDHRVVIAGDEVRIYDDVTVAEDDRLREEDTV